MSPSAITLAHLRRYPLLRTILSLPSQIVFKGRYRSFTLRAQDVLHLAFYLCLWWIIFAAFPNDFLSAQTRAAVWIIGGLGTWRYSWWCTNFARSQCYGRIYFPRLRARAERLWVMGWRPRHVHFVMTTYFEHPQTTRWCIESIMREIADSEVPATLWVGCGAAYDEDIIQDWFARTHDAQAQNVEVRFVRQNISGKRAAIGLTLRALSRHGVQDNDMAVLMDGDSVLGTGSLRQCLSLLGACRNLQAVTTDEGGVCPQSLWMQKWLTMRFAQRRMWMQSHSLSKRILTLTGRFSVFRAAHIVDAEFIGLIEADHLQHWFWGNFRFLSGDDKSSWYYMIAHKCDMIYVPDAMVYTIERIKGSAFVRARDNTLRWSGNMLRNGMRAIRLGPRIVPPYIWWCLIDQRITIWTTLAGFFTAVSTTLFVKHDFFFTYILWIMLTRGLMSVAMFFYSDRMHISYPFILYCNQLLTAFVKVYLIFRLPHQRWANRMDQRFNHALMNGPVYRIAVLYLNVFYLTVLTLAVLLLLRILTWPDIQQLL